MFNSIRGLVVLALVGTMSTAAMAGPLARVVGRVLPGKIAKSERRLSNDQHVIFVDNTPRQRTSFEPAPAAFPVTAGKPDLVLEDVALAADATLIAGPAYAVRFANQGLRPAGKFLVAVFASLDGRPDPNAPRALVEVPGLNPGEMQEVVLRLPAAALHMGPQDAPFSHLILLVDAGNAVDELDESNNVAAVERASIGPAR